MQPDVTTTPPPKSQEIELAVLRADVRSMREEVNSLNRRIDKLATSKDLQDLSDDIQGIREAWIAAGGLVKFVKLVGGLAAAILAALAIFKTWKGIQ